ncbi:MAG: penicillin-binding protein [Oscillospiraceae bacterium]|nr:penicillin-binding protein [Oscillospiraceae bacterium]
MKKLTGRAISVLLILALVLFGTGIYTVRLFEKGNDWALYFSRLNSGSSGVLHDRNGVLLAEFSRSGSFYAEDELTRKACFHILGDYEGRTGSGLISTFTEDIKDYSIFTGTTHSQDYEFTLTLDAYLNRVAYQSIGEDREGCVLVCNYKTGEVLCMVSLPSTDPLYYDPDPPSGTYINKCLGAAFVPGSVFKLVTSAAAIETVSNIWDRRFFCEGEGEIAGVKIACVDPHWTTDFRTALSNSCNYAFAQIAVTVGQENMKKYVSEYGFTERHELNGIRTAAGNFETGYMGDPELAWAGIGQWTDLICPFALLRYVCAVANHGELTEPYIIQGTEPETVQLMKQSTADTLHEMMRFNVTDHYTDERFPGLHLAGKSGTAEVGDGTNNSWFIGFLDDDEHPYAFVVLIEKGGYGLADAGAVANSVMQAAVRSN